LIAGGFLKYVLDNINTHLITLTPATVLVLYSAIIGNDPNIAVTAGLSAALLAIDHALERCSLYIYNKMYDTSLRYDEFQGKRKSIIQRYKRPGKKDKRSCKKDKRSCKK
jgi:hypothetical protein